MPSYLIADGSALEAEWVKGAGIVGLTAGCVAPEVLVDDALDRPDGRGFGSGTRGAHGIPPAGRADRRLCHQDRKPGELTFPQNRLR